MKLGRFCSKNNTRNEFLWHLCLYCQKHTREIISSWWWEKEFTPEIVSHFLSLPNCESFLQYFPRLSNAIWILLVKQKLPIFLMSSWDFLDWSSVFGEVNEKRSFFYEGGASGILDIETRHNMDKLWTPPLF